VCFNSQKKKKKNDARGSFIKEAVASFSRSSKKFSRFSHFLLGFFMENPRSTKAYAPYLKSNFINVIVHEDLHFDRSF
jgi:hypothetical protein